MTLDAFTVGDELLIQGAPFSLREWLSTHYADVAAVIRRALAPPTPGEPVPFDAVKVGSVITFSTGKGQPDSVGTILFVSHTADPKWSRAVIQRHGGGVFELYAAKWAQYNVRGA